MTAAESTTGYGPTMEFRVLGPIEVIDSGRSLELGGGKQRTVLALLVANARQPVSTERLMEGIYGDEAPDGARRSVQTYVSNLRSDIGDQITSVARGYEFGPTDSAVDAERFVQLVEVYWRCRRHSRRPTGDGHIRNFRGDRRGNRRSHRDQQGGDRI